MRLALSSLRIIAAVSAGLAVTFSLGGAPAGATEAARTSWAQQDEVGGTVPPLILLIDTSGSMDDDDGSGSPKMEAAREAALERVVSWPGGNDFALMTYPGTEGTGECAQAAPRVPLGPLDTNGAMSVARGLQADGGTPTGPALSDAADALKERGHDNGVIVLVSDGQSNCGPPPCEVAVSLKGQGIDVVMNTVGFQIEEEGREELECIAAATGGQYRDVTDATDLTASVAAAARPDVTLDVDVPASLLARSGLGPNMGSTASATVRNTGSRRVSDVRVALIFANVGSNAGDIAMASPPLHYLGNLEPGASRTVSFRVRPPDRPGGQTWEASLSAEGYLVEQTNGVSVVTDKVTPQTMGPFLSKVDHVAVVGDSYSSGEGSGVYLPGTFGSSGNDCHRSEQTYAYRIYGAKTHIIACSGAVTSHVTAMQDSGEEDYWPEAQAAALRELALSDSPPDVVFVTLGGNDVGFGSFLLSCVVAEECSTQVVGYEGDPRITRAGNVDNALVDSYRLIDSAVNDEEAVSKRNGEVAPIVVLPYVRITPDNRHTKAQSNCFVGLSKDELEHSNRMVDALNGAVLRASLTLRADERPVYYSTDIVDTFQPDNSICADDDGYAVTPKVSDLKAVMGADSEKSREYAHPNSAGYGAEARALAAWSASVAAPSVLPPTRPAPAYSEKRVSGRVLTGTPGMIDGWVVGGVAWQLRYLTALTPGGITKVVATNLLAGSVAAIWVESTPTPLGTTTVGPDGSVDTLVQIPDDVPPGEHTIVVEGYDDNAQPVAIRQTINVSRPGTNTALLMFYGAGALLAAALVTAAAARWRRRSATRVD